MKMVTLEDSDTFVSTGGRPISIRSVSIRSVDSTVVQNSYFLYTFSMISLMITKLSTTIHITSKIYAFGLLELLFFYCNCL